MRLNLQSITERNVVSAYQTPRDNIQEVKTDRIMTPAIESQIVPKLNIRDRAKSNGKSHGIKSWRSSRPITESTCFSSISEINNIVTENLSIINHVRVISQSNSNSVLGSARQDSQLQTYNSPREILNNDMFSPREDNRTPEGDIITLINSLPDSSTLRKEVGRLEADTRVKTIFANNSNLMSEM